MNDDIEITADVARHFAVVIGIDLYESSDILPPLRGPRNDANSFARWLADSGRLLKDHVQVVKASFRADESEPISHPLVPTLDDIHDALDRANRDVKALNGGRSGVVPNSRLYIFVAGHGMAKVRASAALFAPNARPHMWGRALNLQECIDWYKEHGPFAEVAVFADVCRTRYEKVGLMGLPFTVAPCPGDKKLWIFFATLDDDEAFEDPFTSPDPSSNRGYFSRALTECLSSAIWDAGYVTSSELSKNIRKRVQDLSEPLGPARQTCATEAPGVIDPPLVFSPPAGYCRVKVVVESTAQNGALELRDDSLQTIAHLDPAATGDVWQLALAPGDYSLVWSRGTLDVPEHAFRAMNGTVTVHV